MPRTEGKLFLVATAAFKAGHRDLPPPRPSLFHVTNRPRPPYFIRGQVNYLYSPFPPPPPRPPGELFLFYSVLLLFLLSFVWPGPVGFARSSALSPLFTRCFFFRSSFSRHMALGSLRADKTRCLNFFFVKSLERDCCVSKLSK